MTDCTGEEMMSLTEAIDARHAVRAYTDRPIPAGIREKLDAFASRLSEESGLHLLVRYDDPEGFDSVLARYGRFRNVKNYIVLAGNRNAAGEGSHGAGFDFDCGYYGEQLVLYAQQLGLNTCWAAMTFNKKFVKDLLPAGEELVMAISLGYGQTQGHPHKGKIAADVIDGAVPEWMTDGIEAALKAPTAINQQKFAFSEEGGQPCIRVKGIGPCTRVDLGIAAFHFEAAAGRRLTVK